MAGTVIFTHGNTRLVRDGDKLLPETSDMSDSAGTQIWLPAPQHMVESILREAVLNLDNRIKDRDQDDYDRAEAEARRQARGR